MIESRLPALERHELRVAHGEATLALVRMIVETIVACQESVLQDETETAMIIRQAARHALAAHGARLGTFWPAGLAQAAAALVDFAVQSVDAALTERLLAAYAAEPAIGNQQAATRATTPQEEPLADWFTALHANLQAIHPLAGQVLRARLAGLDSRTIAARLELPPGLVRRMLRTIGSRGGGQPIRPGDAA
jgi:hypothetical protein